MSVDYDLSLFIFRRDLRLNDNTALLRALQRSKYVIPCFIFDPLFFKEDRRNDHSIQFLIESLGELNQQLRTKNTRLFFFYGKPAEVIHTLISEHNIDAIFVNEDYSRYSQKRDNSIQNVCKSNDVRFFKSTDYLLTAPHSIFTGSWNRYQVFTYYYKFVLTNEVKPVQTNPYRNYILADQMFVEEINISSIVIPRNDKLYTHGGRKNGIMILSSIEDFSNYSDTRDMPANEAGTTHLSAHIKFGTLSIREVYHTLRTQFDNNHPLIRQLYWREFYIYLSIHFSHVFTAAFKLKYNRIKWSDDHDLFEKWSQGMTGFPIIDAGMRQLNQTGYMHNRVRMIVAAFLVKDLHINWQWGEKYFARKLIDFDVMVNNGNWQWAASTGADAQPYFRIFNPWSQQKKYDPKAEYIKKYIPEIKNLDAETILRLENQRPLDDIDYPEPIVNHKIQSQQAKNLFRAVSS